MSTTLHVLRRGWRTSPELREGMAGTIGLALVAAAGRVAVPVLLQIVVDGGVSWATALGGAAVVVVTAFAARSTRTRLARSGENALCGLRTRAFRHIHRLSLATLSEERRGTLVGRVTTDVETMSQFLSWGGIAWVTSGATMATVLVVMAAYDWRLTLVAVAVVVPLALVLRAIQHRLAGAYSDVRTRVGVLLATLSEAIAGVALVRAYGPEAEAHVGGRVQGAVTDVRDSGIRAGTISAFLFPMSDVFSALAVAAVIVAGVVLGPAAGLSTGELVAFVFLVLIFLEPVAEFTEIVDQTQTAVAGWRRVLDVLDTPVEVPEPVGGVVLPPGPPELRLEHVSFSYDGRVPALDDVSVVIPAGRRVAVVGATGSGKTTMAKLLTRLADPQSGRVLVAGVYVREVASASLRSTLVMVPQEGFLFDTTVGENVRFGRPGAGEADVRLAFTELGLLSWLDGLPRGLDTPVGSRGEHLSVGERQLVSLARAYVANPACLILDEATSAVDPATEMRLARAVASLERGRTSVTIAHRLSTAERADLVLVMAGGRLVEQGTHAELLARGGVYADLHGRWVAGVTTGADVDAG